MHTRMHTHTHRDLIYVFKKTLFEQDRLGQGYKMTNSKGR